MQTQLTTLEEDTFATHASPRCPATWAWTTSPRTPERPRSNARRTCRSSRTSRTCSTRSNVRSSASTRAPTGVCERCGKPIEKARIKALPYVDLCIKDAQARVAPVAPWTACSGAAPPYLFAVAGAAYLLDRLTKLLAERTPAGRAGRADPRRARRSASRPTPEARSASFGERPVVVRGATIVVSVLIVATAFRHRSVLTAIGARADPGRRARQPHRPGGAGPGVARARSSTSSTSTCGPSSTSRTPRSSWAPCCWRSLRCVRSDARDRRT